MSNLSSACSTLRVVALYVFYLQACCLRNGCVVALQQPDARLLRALYDLRQQPLTGGAVTLDKGLGCHAIGEVLFWYFELAGADVF